MLQAITNQLNRLTELKAKLDSYRPLPTALVNNLQEWFRIELTYSSNALEGNTLTSSETAMVVEKGITVGGKTVREHLEAINHAHAFDYIVSIAQSKKEDIYLDTILDIHHLLLRAINLSGEALAKSDNINEFIEWLHDTKEHPVIVAAQAHLKLVTIHPFVDGNGRTARLLLNLLLLQYGYPIVLIMPDQRKEYIDALVQAQIHNNLIPYYELIIASIETSFAIYFDCIEKSILSI